MENKKPVSTRNLKYINVPLSIVSQRWYKKEKAVRAWFFMAWQALMPHYENNQTKTVKGQTFHLTEGELICTRSYLAKSLSINESAAKSSTDSLKRAESISVKQERMADGDCKSLLSRIAVKGIPMPDEPYVKMYFPTDVADFWEMPHLAQIYTYLMCHAYHCPMKIVGTGGFFESVEVGDVLLNYSRIIDDIKCSEWQLKKMLRVLETGGVITRRKRVGNRGVLIHLDYYPLQNSEKKSAKKESARATAKQRQTAQADSAPQATAKAHGKQKEEIKNTPVTEAIEYLFFDLKKNKDIVRLNQIIEDVNANLPEGFPIENLKDAIDFYYKQYGEQYINTKNLIKAITAYRNKCLQRQAAHAADERKYEELKAEKKKIYAEYSQNFASWDAVERAYRNVYLASRSLARIPSDYMSSIYFALWCANNKAHYLDANTLTKAQSEHIGQQPQEWEHGTRKKAAYIMAFFEHIADIDALLKSEKAKLKEQYAKAVADIDRQMIELKSA